MRFITFDDRGEHHCGVVTGHGVAPVSEINARLGTRAPDDLLEIIQTGADMQLRGFEGVDSIPWDEITPQLPYPVPPKIWCIGLNYRTHADDINAVQPEEPGSFMKPSSCMIPPGGEIVLPPVAVSNDVDAEG